MHLVRRGTPLLAVLTALALPARAQAPDGSSRLSVDAVAESLVVLRTLDSLLVRQPHDASAWYRRGMLTWALYERDRSKPPIPGLDWVTLGRMADTSLRMAARIEESNVRYRMMAGRFMLQSGASISRVASYGFIDAALEAARKSKDPYIRAVTALEAGRVHWRRYDSYAHRWMDLGIGDCVSAARTTGVLLNAVADSGKGVGAKAVMDELLKCAKPVGSNVDFPGQADYIAAERLFREAFEAQPAYQRAYQQLAMLLAERYRWRELEVAARARIEAASWDAWAWMTLGLALHRQGGHADAVAAAFDSAWKLLPRPDVRRLDRLERVLRPSDTLRMLALDSTTHEATQRLYWLAADPLWSREGNEPHVEFLARVTYAELRWTVEELNVRGADSDRGDVHIRYGPPDLIAATNPAAGVGGASGIATTWVYNVGFQFTFVGQPTFGTARIPPTSVPSFEDIVASTPVSWSNIYSITVDTMPVQAVRFRAAQDSVDLYLATLPPITQIKRVAEVRGKVRSDFWLLAGGLATLDHDTATADSPGVRVYQKRVGPGNYVYRAEASADGALYAARATAAFVAGHDTTTGFSTRGFGVSDIMLATSVSSKSVPARWHDLSIQPLTGMTVRKGQISLVWENYELASDSGVANYTVSVTLQRERGLIGKIAAEVAGRVSSAIGMDRADDRVTLHFDRATPHATALVEQVTLGLGQTAAGDYTLIVAVTDRISGRTVARSLRIAVPER